MEHTGHCYLQWHTTTQEWCLDPIKPTGRKPQKEFSLEKIPLAALTGPRPHHIFIQTNLKCSLMQTTAMVTVNQKFLANLLIYPQLLATEHCILRPHEKREATTPFVLVRLLHPLINAPSALPLTLTMTTAWTRTVPPLSLLHNQALLISL